ncbi:hypothetical protein GOP47_0022745 [Adiantum capillus-veneris]|uniref:Uncharacterized protein n=1 Tax=Adiantum capillus-veneris TaxID=13818 RepID=A0A9D4U8B0_ADICA|nr:hypothetical protein GOP47_0022745 [Adiantum capillus-veneris]
MAKTDEGKKKRPRPTGSEGSAKSNKEDGKTPQDVVASAVQDKSSLLWSKESPLTKKVRMDEQNVSKTPEHAEDKQMKVSPILDSTGSKKKPKSSPGVDDLRLYVESLGGMLEDGWQVDSYRRHGKLTKTYISPTSERFRSRVEVAKHLGLARNSLKKGEPYLSNEITPSQMDNDKEEQLDTATDGYVTSSPRIKKGSKSKLHEHSSAEVSVQKKEHGSNIPDFHEESVINTTNGPTLTCSAFKGIADVQKTPVTSIVTERCQDALRSIISTENFATLSNILNRGSPSGSIESPLQLKALPGSIDLQLIHLRLSNGVYGLTPELFSADIKQVWRNISAVGNELVALAQSLLEFSDKLYKQQIISLFQGAALKDVSEGKGQLHIDAQHGKPCNEENLISLKDSHVLKGNPPGKPTVLQTNKGPSVQEKELPTQTYKSKRLSKKEVKSKKPLVFKMKVADKVSGVCKSCGLEQGMDYIMCRLCQAAFHMDCTGIPSNKLQEGEWCCPSCTKNENKSKKLAASDETTKQLHKSAGKSGVCEACKTEDDNVLRCDGCEAAYHMNCIIPAIGSVPDESWYCPKCAENQRSSGKDVHDDSSKPDGHNCSVCIRIPKVSAVANDTEHDAEHEVSEHPSPISEGRPPDESVENAAPKEVKEPGSSVATVDDEPPEPRFLLGNENACKVCGSESTKSMISCSFCTNRFHMSCLQPPLKRMPRNTWYCPSCLCRVCKIDADDDKILLCDTCDEGYHTYCLNPPLTDKPKGAWFCPSCAKPEEVPDSTSPKQNEVSKRKRKSTEPRRST